MVDCTFKEITINGKKVMKKVHEIIQVHKYYRFGNKRCRFCDVFIKHEGTFCPCCTTKLKTIPVGSIRKRKYYKPESEKRH